MRARRAAGTATVVALAAAAFVATGVSPAAAGSYTVDSTGTGPDANPGDGICADAMGACTLNAALDEAATSDQFPNVITLPDGTYPLGDTPSPINRPTFLIGAGQAATTIDGTGLDGFTVENASFGLEGLTFASSDSVGIELDGNGGGTASLQLDAATVTNHDAGGVDTNAVGANTMLVVELTNGAAIDGNTNGIGLDVNNVGPATTTVAITDSSVDGNDYGIRFNNVTIGAGTLTLERSSVSDNTGPGVSVNSNATQTAVTISDSTLGGNAGAGLLVNSTNGGGGATTDIGGSTVSGNAYGVLINAANGTSQSMAMRNSTVSDNLSSGIDLQGPNQGIVDADLTYVTVSGNDSGLTGASFATIDNTVIAHNDSADCGGPVGAVVGVNLDSDSTCDLGAGQLDGVDPLLGALADNGGPTETQLPAEGSPLIDATDCTAGIAVDQRGEPRPAAGSAGADGTRCDIGSVEVAYVDPPASTTTSAPTTTSTTSPPSTPGATSAAAATAVTARPTFTG